jgi:polysaccharide export outer membrane protein
VYSFCACFFIMVLLVAAQTAAPPIGELVSTNLPLQRLGPNDLLTISVYGSPELSRSARVSTDGFIRLPMLKSRLKADGILPAELESVIAEALRSEELVVDPYVTVVVAEYHSRPISVAGAVKAPLTFQASGPLTLLEALTRAGGLTPTAGADILVTRLHETGNELVQRIPVRGLIEARDPKWNITLEGNEEIRIPEVGKVYVVGNVKRPGAYAVEGDSETSVLRVLALAEGLSAFAGNQAFIYRREANGAKNEIPIELKKLLDRKTADATLLADDILYVPDNSGRRLGHAVLDRVLMFGATAGATALVYGQVR